MNFVPYFIYSFDETEIQKTPDSVGMSKYNEIDGVSERHFYEEIEYSDLHSGGVWEYS